MHMYTYIGVFGKFWSMGQIGSKMVSVCAIRNTSWANPQSVNCVSDNMIITNCATGPKKELYCAKQEALWAYGVQYKLIKNTDLR